MTAILPRRLRVHPCLGRRNLLAFLCLYQRKQPPNLPVCDQSASAPMNRNTLGLIVVGSGTLFVVSQELLLSPVNPCSLLVIPDRRLALAGRGTSVAMREREGQNAEVYAASSAATLALQS